MSESAPHNASLYDEIGETGFYPGVAVSQLRNLLGDQRVRAAVVAPEFSLDSDGGLQMECLILVLTDRQVIWWGGYEQAGSEEEPAVLHAHSRVLPLSRVHDVRLSTSIDSPSSFDDGDVPDGVRLVMTTSQIDRVEIESVPCSDEGCDGAHASLGDVIPDAVVTSLTKAGAGDEKVRQLLTFAADLSALLGRG